VNHVDGDRGVRMTIEIVIKCDGPGCHEKREIDDYSEFCVRHIGWNIDYRTGLHFCPACWPKTEKEMGNGG